MTKGDIYNFLQNLIIPKVKSRIIVFESDDWGAQRMPNIEVFNFLRKTDWFNISSCPFSEDSLEKELDIDFLSQILSSYHNENYKTPIFTLNYILANPDFQKISNSNFSEYHYTNIEQTYRNMGFKTLEHVKKGIEKRVFEVQFHGREHLNVPMYLDLLKSNKYFLQANQCGLFMVSFNNLPSINKPYLASFHPYGEEYLENQSATILDGLNIFKNIFGVEAKSFIAPVYDWYEELENILAEKTDIKSIQGKLKRRGKNINSFKFRRIKSNKKLINLYRNIHFEPKILPENCAENALYQINTAFRLNVPAIISTHRLNYVSNINKSKTQFSLDRLNVLLKNIIKRWPDVKFMSSSELADEYKKNH